MVVDDFHVVRIAVPAEADAELVVDTDAVLALAIAYDFLQAVRGGHAEVFQRLRSVQNQQLPQRRTLEWASELASRFASEQPFRFSVSEAADHARYSNATR